MTTIPEHLRYTTQHEWVSATEEGTLRVGITDYAQDALGDIVYVDLPEIGRALAVGDSFGEVESTKSVSDVYAPIAGTVVAVNDALESTPDVMNTDPYGDGWILEIGLADSTKVDVVLEELLDARAYSELVNTAG